MKAIAHHGSFLLKTVAGFREIAGQEVIRAHRLLKNTVRSDEYLILTEPVSSRFGNHRADDESRRGRQGSRRDNGLGLFP